MHYPDLRPGPTRSPVGERQRDRGFFADVLPNIFEPFFTTSRPGAALDWGWPSCTASPAGRVVTSASHSEVGLTMTFMLLFPAVPPPVGAVVSAPLLAAAPHGSGNHPASSMMSPSFVAWRAWR